MTMAITNTVHHVKAIKLAAEGTAAAWELGKIITAQ